MSKSRKQSESLQPRTGEFPDQAPSFTTPGSSCQIYRLRLFQPSLLIKPQPINLQLSDFKVYRREDFQAYGKANVMRYRNMQTQGKFQFPALNDVYEGEITLRVSREAITFNLDQTLRYTANYNHMIANRIDVIDLAYEEYSKKFLVSQSDLEWKSHSLQ
ncbi:hypothetical protein Tco_1379087 [Tanacetum coccineum]